jgi:hypothetical protein
MEIKLLQHTKDFLSGTSGLNLGIMIDKQIQTQPNQIINISFYGVDSITPSFINGVLLYIIDLYGMEYFKNYVKLTEINSKILNTIKDSVNKHFEYKNSFFAKLNTNKYYIATDGTELGEKIKLYLHSLNNSGKAIILSNVTNSYFTEKSKQSIQNSNSIIGILTNEKGSNFLFKQINFALLNNKLILVLCEKSIYIKIPEVIKQKVQILRYSSNNILKTTRDLNEIILQNTSGKNNITFEEGLLWGGLAVLGGLLLKELYKPIKN